jgi:hypothetical protein
MTCEWYQIPGGGTALVRFSGRRKPKPCACGRHSTRLCDWLLTIGGGHKATCDVPLCDRCTHSPAKDKDLCPKHAAEWAARKPGAPA